MKNTSNSIHESKFEILNITLIYTNNYACIYSILYYARMCFSISLGKSECKVSSFFLSFFSCFVHFHFSIRLNTFNFPFKYHH